MAEKEQKLQGSLTYPVWACFVPFGVEIYHAFSSKAAPLRQKSTPSTPSDAFYSYKSGFGSGKLAVHRPETIQILPLAETGLGEGYEDYALIGFQDPSRSLILDTIFIANTKKQNLRFNVSAGHPLKVEIFSTRDKTSIDFADLIQRSPQIKEFYEKIAFPYDAASAPGYHKT